MAQQDMNICAETRFRSGRRRAERRLERGAPAAKELDAELCEDLKGAEKALLAAQRGWIGYRDGQCELAGFEARGGSMEPMLVSGCLAELTRARTKELKASIRGAQ